MNIFKVEQSGVIMNVSDKHSKHFPCENCLVTLKKIRKLLNFRKANNAFNRAKNPEISARKFRWEDSQYTSQSCPLSWKFRQICIGSFFPSKTLEPFSLILFLVLGTTIPWRTTATGGWQIIMKKLERQVWIWLKDDVETAKQFRGYQVHNVQMDFFWI